MTCTLRIYKHSALVKVCNITSIDALLQLNVCVCKDAGAGLLAAAMIAVVPGYISRSVAGSYDNEGTHAAAAGY